MCIGRPSMPSPQIVNQPAPMAPPPPTPVAEEVEDKRKKKKDPRRRGTSSLTIRRPSVSLPSEGSGANVNY